MTEATPVGKVQDHDGIVYERRDEGNDPVPHYVKDVQEILWARRAAQPVGPVRINAVRESKKVGRRVKGLLIRSMRNNMKKGGRCQTNKGESSGINIGRRDITEGDRDH